jgi:chromosome segregation ATPase
MTDIVEQLRDLQSGAQWVCGETAATLSDAADEIERLRAERDEARRNARAWQSAAHTAGQYREQERSRAERAEAERNEADARGNRWASQAQRAGAERDAHRDAHAAAQNVLNALYGERSRLRVALDGVMNSHGEQLHDAFAVANAILKETGHE